MFWNVLKVQTFSRGKWNVSQIIMTSSPGKYIQGELVFIIIIMTVSLLDESTVIAS